MENENKLMTAERFGNYEKVTGFYYQVIPPSNPVIRFMLKKRSLLDKENNFLAPRHYLLQQDNLDLDLISVKSVRIKPNTLREATKDEIEIYIKTFVKYNKEL